MTAGNSVSTFSALQILSRMDNFKLFGLSNGGDVPLGRFLPSLSTVQKRLSRPLYWVFSYTDSGDSFLREHLLAAVQSALERTSLRPVCVFTGSLDSPLARWLSRHGVRLLQRALSFAHNISTIDDEVSATLMRVDVPLIAELAEEEVVLYTDVDVLFLDDVRSFSVPIPSYIACGPKDDPLIWSPCDAGVLFLNVANMKQSHHAFVRHILARMGSRGQSIDQDAIYRFYHGKVTKLPLEFNWKPYWSAGDGVKIFHFLGPKLRDIHIYLENGTIREPSYSKLLRQCNLGTACAWLVEHFLQVLRRASISF